MDTPNTTLWGFIKACENALVATAIVLEPITRPFFATIRLCLYACAALVHKLGDVVVNTTASFMSAVLRHPDVVDAASAVMVRGINDFAAQPDLADKLKQVNKHMTQQDKEEAAVQIGRDLPVLVGGIFHGVFSRNDDNNDKKKSIEEEKSGGEEEKENDNGDAPQDKTSTNKDNKVVVYVSDDNGNGEIVEKCVTTSQ